MLKPFSLSGLVLTHPLLMSRIQTTGQSIVAAQVPSCQQSCVCSKLCVPMRMMAQGMAEILNQSAHVLDNLYKSVM